PDIRFNAVSCAFAEARWAPMCTGEVVPARIMARINKARGLIRHAARTRTRERARRFVSRAMTTLARASKIAARAEARGTLSGDCTGSLRDLLFDAQDRAGRWLGKSQSLPKGSFR